MKQIQEACEVESSLYQNVKKYCLEKPNLIAFRYFRKAFTYKHLYKRIHQFANSLKKLGVKPGDPVTICLPNIPDALYLLYSINAIGAIANIVHPLFTSDQMKETLEITKSKIVFTLDIKMKEF
ncbi:MAG: AMP-binding protein, partial [Bacilli bacterium]|nr:AMP-binding protein [Bacilli bacterium]